MQKSSKSTLTNEECLEYLMAEADKFALDIEEIPLVNSLNRVLAFDVISDTDIPGADTSSRDGYCVKADSISAASDSTPVELLVQSGEIHAGHEIPCLDAGKCMYIATGGVLPDGADSVVMFEDVSVSKDEHKVIFKKPVGSESYVRVKASEMHLGETVAHKFDVISPELAGKIVSAGTYNVKVLKKPVVGILTSGDEIVQPWEKPEPWQVRTSNPTVMTLLVEKSGGICKDFGVAKDTGDDIFNRFIKAVEECDVVVTSGGIAMGRHDPVRNMFANLGIESDFQKYGSHFRPVFYTVYKNKPIFAIPGTPIGMYNIFNKFVVPFLLKQQHIIK